MTASSDPPLSHGGTRPRPTSELRSPVLRRFGQAAAEASLSRIYQTWPELLDRYAERGRQLSAEDNLWHLNFLDASFALDDSSLFDRYADWLLAFLQARELSVEHVTGAFRFLADALEQAAVEPEWHSHQQALLARLRQTALRLERQHSR